MIVVRLIVLLKIRIKILIITLNIVTGRKFKKKIIYLLKDISEFITNILITYRV